MSIPRPALPRFVIAVSLLMAAVGLAFAFCFFTRPASLLTEIDMGSPPMQRLAFTLGTRSLTMALALLAALGLRSREALICVLLMRLVTECLDLFNIVAGPHDASVLVVVPAMIVLELITLALLWRHRPAST